VGENGLQYLFGFAVLEVRGELKYEKRWALNREEEKKGFEWLVDQSCGDGKRIRNARVPLRGLRAWSVETFDGNVCDTGRPADRLLRAGALVDLHQVFKQGVRASVEEYSLKKLEAFCGFERKTPLEASRAAMRYVEHRLELGWEMRSLPQRERETMEGYNAEDCFSTAKLRDWLKGNGRSGGTGNRRSPTAG